MRDHMSQNKIIILLLGIALIFSLAACGSVKQAEPVNQLEGSNETQSIPEVSNVSEDTIDEYMHLFIDDTEVLVEWNDNEAVDALYDMVEAGPIIIDMSMYGGFEQVGPLGKSLPRNDVRTTAQAGDIMLYSGDKIVVYYVSNTWEYTRLGRITDKTEAEMAELLGGGNVTITISYGGQ